MGRNVTSCGGMIGPPAFPDTHRLARDFSVRNVGGVRELRRLIALEDGLHPWSGQPWERGTIEALATPQFAVNYAGGNEAK